MATSTSVTITLTDEQAQQLAATAKGCGMSSEALLQHLAIHLIREDDSDAPALAHVTPAPAPIDARSRFAPRPAA